MTETALLKAGAQIKTLRKTIIPLGPHGAGRIILPEGAIGTVAYDEMVPPKTPPHFPRTGPDPSPSVTVSFPMDGFEIEVSIYVAHLSAATP